MFRRVDQPLTEERVREALKAVKFPGFSRDIVSFGLIKSIEVGRNHDVTVALHVMTRDPAVPAQIETDVKTALSQVEGIGHVNVQMTAQQPPQQAMTMAPGVPAKP